MRAHTLITAGIVQALAAGLLVLPVWSQSLSQGLSQSQQPSQQEVEQFCASWGQLSGSQRKQYQAQYEQYCDRPSLQPETTIIQPVEPEQPQQQQPQQQKPQKPEEPAEPEAPEPQIEPARPEPAVPEPEPSRVDLVGELVLDGPLARQPGERQRLRVTVKNRGPGGGPHAPAVNRLWTRVFLSDRDVSRHGASAGAFSFSGGQQGRPVRVPGVPAPGRSREVTAEVVLPATLDEGQYWWCVRVDTRQQIEETDEDNNVACAPKVVALGGESDSELSGVFGSKVDELQERDAVAERPEVVKNLRVRLPEYVQPLMDEMPVLSVNGSDPMAPVTVGEDGSAVAAWDFPAETDVDEIFLRIHRDPIASSCPAPGTDRATGQAELERCPDCRVEADDGFHGDASGWQSLQLAEHYELGSVYYLQACGLSGEVFNGTQTNTVTLGYGTTPPGTMAAFPVDPSMLAGAQEADLPELPELPTLPPDFVVRHVGVSNRPESEGQLYIRISDQSGRWADFLSEAGSSISRWRLGVVPMPVDIKVNGDLLTRPESPDRVMGEPLFPDASVAGFIFPHGEALLRIPTEMYKLPADGDSYDVEVSINQPAKGALIPETNIANNSDSRVFSREPPVMRVGAIATRFRVETVGESDQDSPAEMQHVYVRVCNDSTGVCSEQVGYHSGSGEIRAGAGDAGDPVEVFAGDVVEVVRDPSRGYLEVPGTREDQFSIEVTAFEFDPYGTQATRRAVFWVPAEEAESSGADPCPVFEPFFGGFVDSWSDKGPHLTPLNATVRVCYPASEE